MLTPPVPTLKSKEAFQIFSRTAVDRSYKRGQHVDFPFHECKMNNTEKSQRNVSNSDPPPSLSLPSNWIHFHLEDDIIRFPSLSPINDENRSLGFVFWTDRLVTRLPTNNQALYGEGIFGWIKKEFARRKGSDRVTITSGRPVTMRWRTRHTRPRPRALGLNENNDDDGCYVQAGGAFWAVRLFWFDRNLISTQLTNRKESSRIVYLPGQLISSSPFRHSATPLQMAELGKHRSSHNNSSCWHTVKQFKKK